MFSIKFKRIHTGPAGFTLIELIITVAVIGILAGIGFPSIMKWVPNYKIKAAAQELNGNMQKARLDAIKTNSKVSATFVTVSPCTAAGGGSYTFTNDESAQVLASVSFSNGLCLSAGTVNGFDPRGLPKGATGSVTLEHAQITRSYTITQTIAGGVRVQ